MGDGAQTVPAILLHDANFEDLLGVVKENSCPTLQLPREVSGLDQALW